MMNNSTNNFSRSQNQPNNFGNISQIDYNSFDPHENLSTNIIGVLEKEVEKLKKEHEEFNKAKNIQKPKRKVEIYEDKVKNNYLCAKDDRMQMLKHVNTQEKAEYL